MNVLKKCAAVLAALLCLVSNSFAQNLKIKGRVVDAGGAPLVGVLVASGDKKITATTDLEGNYSISVPRKETVLEFSFLGMKTQSVFINNRVIIDVVLEADAEMRLDESVVVGYGETKVRDLTGAVTHLSSDQIQNSFSSTLDQALKGKIAGVQIIQGDGTPGGRVSIKIRGTNSITAGSAPLYVIDGFPMPYSDDPTQNPLNSLPPSSIESISILKDASSTAIYGSQGANGVVLITTKTARAGMNDLSVNISYGIGNIMNPQRMLTTDEYMKNFMRSNYKNADADLYDLFVSGDWKDASRVTDWIDECTHPSVIKSVDVSYLGSIANRVRNTTNVSLSDDGGTIIGSGYKRFYILQQNDITINKKISLNTRISYEHSKRFGANWVDGGIFNDMLTFCPFVKKEWTWQDTIDNLDLHYNSPGDNPYMRLTEKDYKADTRNLYANVTARWNILYNLSLSAGYDMGYNSNENKTYISQKIKSSFDSGGFASMGTWKNTTSRFHTQLDYYLAQNKHYFTATAAFETNVNTTESYSQSYTKIADDLGWYGIQRALPGDHVAAPVAGYNQKKMASVLGRLTYNYADKYYATFNLREDGSSRFSRHNRWGFFPSAALSWRPSNEAFWQNSDWIGNWVNDFKIRLSWGRSGNDQIADYQYFQFLSPFSQTATFTGAGGEDVLVNAYQLSIMPSDVRWETSTEWNLGIDANLLNNRLILTAEAYNKVTKDMLLSEKIALTSGFETMTNNIGSVRNRGLELSLTGVVVQNKNWDYSVNVVYSANRSKVLSLGSRTQTLEGRSIAMSGSENILIKEGYPLGLYFGNIINGIANNQITNRNAYPSYYSAVNPTTSKGNQDLVTKYIVGGKFIFDDLDGDGYTDLTDRAPIACVEPAFIGGMSHTVRYKWFTLNANFSWSYGNDIINANVYSLINAGYGINNKLASVADNTWGPNNTDGTYTGNGSYRYFSNSELVEDGSFFRLNNLSLTARMPEKWLSKIKVKDIALTYSIRNVFCLTRYSGYDPEVNSGSSSENQILSGVDYASYPTVRSHVFSLNFKF